MSSKREYYSEKLKSHFISFSQEARELYLDTRVPIIDSTPSPLEFYREYVSKNKPVVFKNATKNWKAVQEWTHQYLRNIIGELTVTAAVTPNGYADGISDGKFVMPEERVLTMNSFLDIMEHPADFNGIFYIQKQNSNLTDEFSTLIQDVEADVSWATEAFGKKPDAVNFWMGDERAVTSMHKDHYENLYCVISGQKTFILLPPSDQPFIPYDNFQAAVYQEKSDGHFVIVDDTKTGEVPWIAVDPLHPDFETYPEYKNAKPLIVTLDAGDMLYLPSLWFHHVQQSHACISVNYWYDMEFDIKYNYYKLVEGLLQSTGKDEEMEES